VHAKESESGNCSSIIVGGVFEQTPARIQRPRLIHHLCDRNVKQQSCGPTTDPGIIDHSIPRNGCYSKYLAVVSSTKFLNDSLHITESKSRITTKIFLETAKACLEHAISVCCFVAEGSQKLEESRWHF
jgi:hypothetical protein